MRLRIDEVTTDGKKPLLALEGGQPAVSALVGRDLTCELPISSEAVSRSHGRLFGFQSGWAYLDLNSTNGSWINGQKVLGKSLVALADGDYLQIADIVTRVSYETKLFTGISSRKIGWRLFVVKDSLEGLELDPDDFEGQIVGQEGVIFEQRSDSSKGVVSFRVVTEEASLPIYLNGQEVTHNTDLKFGDQVVCGDFLYLVVVGDLSNEKTTAAAPIIPAKVATQVDLTAVTPSEESALKSAQVYSADRTSFVEPERIAALKFGDRRRLELDEDDNGLHNYSPPAGWELGPLESLRQFFFRLTDIEKRIILGALFFLIISFVFLILLLII
jgi:hypothetical protein